jgi:hypothetical protein
MATDPRVWKHFHRAFSSMVTPTGGRIPHNVMLEFPECTGLGQEIDGSMRQTATLASIRRQRVSHAASIQSDCNGFKPKQAGG